MTIYSKKTGMRTIIELIDGALRPCGFELRIYDNKSVEVVESVDGHALVYFESFEHFLFGSQDKTAIQHGTAISFFNWVRNRDRNRVLSGMITLKQMMPRWLDDLADVHSLEEIQLKAAVIGLSLDTTKSTIES